MLAFEGLSSIVFNDQVHLKKYIEIKTTFWTIVNAGKKSQVKVIKHCDSLTNIRVVLVYKNKKSQTYYADNIVRPNCTVTCTIGLISVKESIFDVHSKIVRKY